MISFNEFPLECRYDDGRLAEMSLKELQQCFDNAKLLLFGKEYRRWEQCMWSAIERARANPSKQQMQNVLDRLEEYKRNLGRRYNVNKEIEIMLKYNEIERDIRWLQGQYELERRSKPYFLGPKY